MSVSTKEYNWYVKIPFIIAAVLMVFIQTIACLTVFSNLFAAFGEGFVIRIYLDIPLIWICIVIYLLICHHNIKQIHISKWTMILPAIIPIIDILSKAMIIFAINIRNDELIDVITGIWLARLFCVMQFISIIPFVISLILRNSTNMQK